MPRCFFTSDSHFGHRNIVKCLSDWSDISQCRDFPSIPAMNDALVNGINSVVSPDDVLYHLGDFNFGGIKNQREFRSRINCETIHLILGNHDFNHGQLDHTTIDHGFASIQHYREIVVEGQEIILSHYAFRVWNRQSKGSWNLYGHSHGMLPPVNNFSLDVGVDAKSSGKGSLFGVPLLFQDIKEYFKRRGDRVKCEDGHVKEEYSRPLN